MFTKCFRLMVTVTHSVPSSSGSNGRNVRFLHAAFNKSGDGFIASDHHGNIFLFDLCKNRWVINLWPKHLNYCLMLDLCQLLLLCLLPQYPLNVCCRLVIVVSFYFSLSLARFVLIQKTGHPCTALAFSLHRPSEFLVALSDYSLKCFDAGNFYHDL